MDVRYTTGMEAAPSNVMPSGILDIRDAGERRKLPIFPGIMPKTRSPGWRDVTEGPTRVTIPDASVLSLSKSNRAVATARSYSY